MKQYLPHQFALPSLAPGQPQATAFQQVVVPHITQVLQEAPSNETVITVALYEPATLLSSSEQQTSKPCLRIHISVSQPSIAPQPKILIIRGKSFKIMF
jgi:hypothetical protein